MKTTKETKQWSEMTTKEKFNTIKAFIILLFIVYLIGSCAFGGGDDKPVEDTKPTVTQSQSTNTGVKLEDAQKKIERMNEGELKANEIKEAIESKGYKVNYRVFGINKDSINFNTVEQALGFAYVSCDDVTDLISIEDYALWVAYINIQKGTEEGLVNATNGIMGSQFYVPIITRK